MLREQLTAAANGDQKHGAVQSLSSSQLKGYSNKIQRQAAKAVELPYTLVRGTILMHGPAALEGYTCHESLALKAIQPCIQNSLWCEIG